MELSIFGLGYVGTVGLGCLGHLGHRVVGVDVDCTKVDFINSGRSPIVEPAIDALIAECRSAKTVAATTKASQAVLESDVSFICVGTPSTPEGHLNLEGIYTVAKQIGEALAAKTTYHTVAIRSTVLPGTNRIIGEILEEHSGKTRAVDFEVVSNPEFLREGTAVHDFLNPPFSVVGGSSADAKALMREVYEGIEAPFVETEIEVAEMLKYVNNSFHALKIAFANEVGNICKQIAVDARELMRVFCLDTKLNLSPYYLRPGFAYGGSCLPKDLKALATIAHDNYLKCPVLESIPISNQRQKDRLLASLLAANKANIGFLGLSFKAGTDDLRNSPIIDVIEQLLGKGFGVQIYDSNVSLAQLRGANRQFILEKIPYISRFISSDIQKVISESELIVIVNREPRFAEALKSIPAEKLIYDLADLDFPGRVELTGYTGIAW